jgi:uncharacterized protein (DUF302 family)
VTQIAESAEVRIFSSVDHDVNASTVGRSLRPTQLVAFGHPRGGAPLIEDRQTAGIDLPMRAVAWEDEAGASWLTYNDAHWIATRHGLSERAQTPLPRSRTE